MSPAAEVSLVVKRELRKSIRSMKGIILGVLTLLVAGVAALISIFQESVLRENLSGAGDWPTVYEKYLRTTGYDPQTAQYLSHAPMALNNFLMVMVWIGPLLVAILGFDAVAGDVQHRSIRFWTVRTRRWSLLLGKFFGLWALVSIITLTLLTLSGLAVLIRGYVTFGGLLSWGSRFWLISVLIVGAWAALAVLISSRFKTPFLALLATFGTFFMLWVVEAIGWVIHAAEFGRQLSDMKHGGGGDFPVLAAPSWYQYLYPNTYEDLLLSAHPGHVGAGLAACLAYMIVFVGLATLLFAKKDV